MTNKKEAANMPLLFLLGIVRKGSKSFLTGFTGLLPVPNGSKISVFEPYFAAQRSFALHFQHRFASWRARLRRAGAYLSAILACPFQGYIL